MNSSGRLARRLAAAMLGVPFWYLAASSTVAADWPMYRADSARSGHTAEALPEELSLVWSYKAPQEPAPAVWKDRVLAAGDDGYLYCLAVEDGSLLWKLRSGPSSLPPRRR